MLRSAMFSIIITTIIARRILAVNYFPVLCFTLIKIAGMFCLKEFLKAIVEKTKHIFFENV